jgi:TetR/AcrR family transcriptional regulator, fatty acid metabolism regulator protein
MTREKILTAAKILFEEKGFDFTTVRDIAAKAEVNVALINYHFGSKDLLLAALIEQMSGLLHVKLSDITSSDADPEEKLHDTVALMVEKIFVNKRYYQMIHRELSTIQRPELNQQILKTLRRNRDEIKKIIEEGQRKKIFKKDVDLDLTVGTMFGLIHQATHPGFKDKINASGNEDDLKRRIKDHMWEMLKCFLKRN